MIRGKMTSTRTNALVFLLICGWFLLNARLGLKVSLGADDFMNLYGAFATPIWKLLSANILPVSTVFRPFGAAVYLAVYELAGLNSTVFRCLAYAIMLLNLWLLARLGRQVTGRASIGLLAAFLFAYNPQLFDLYLNNGTLYDLLCFTFFLLSLLYYVKIRQSRSGISIRQAVTLMVLGILAINSKEMAASLPVLFLVYDLVYTPPAPSAGRRELLRWLFRDRWPVWALMVLFTVSIAVKTGKGTSFDIPPYQAQFSWHRFKEVAPHLLDEMFVVEADQYFDGYMAALAFLLPVALGLAVGKRSLIFSGTLILVTPLPVLFIPHRGLFVMYLPLAGWALYLAEVVVLVSGRVWRVLTGKRATAGIAACAIACLAVALHSRYQRRSYLMKSEKESSRHSRALIQNLKAMELPIKPGGRLLLLRDAFGTDEWTPFFIVRLFYHDPSLTVDRVKMKQPVTPPEETPPYDFVLDYDGERTFVVQHEAPGGLTGN